MKVLFVTSEAAPFSKTGGLGDVAASLPRELFDKKVSVRVLLPLYASTPPELRDKMKFVKYIYIRLAWRNLYCGLYECKHNGITYYFIDNEYYFKRSELYGYFDDGERFAYFSRAAADIIPELGWTPDIVHCNDWQTALVPIYLRLSDNELLSSIKTVFTIHNIEYQGQFGANTVCDLFGLSYDLYTNGVLRFGSGVSLMKAAILMSDFVTTVSPTYAKELGYAFYARGLQDIISENADKLKGILNGIDTDLYNPETDVRILQNFGIDSIAKKTANKLELQRLVGLNQDENIPLVAMVTRLVHHKGIDLATVSLGAMMNLDMQFVVLGRGEWHYEQRFQNAQQQYAGRVSAKIMYNDNLAMMIYAGADILLMPSQTEPCGISQMIGMRYGTVPVVRETGGLRDTVQPYDPDTGAGNGFAFSNFNADDMMYVLKQAIDCYGNKKVWQKLITNCMSLDLSWSKSAAEYIALYKSLLSQKGKS